MINDVVEVKASVIYFVAGVICFLARLEPALHSSIDGKQEFHREELVYCDLISKALLVSSNLEMEMVQAFGEDALLAEENP